MKIFSMSAYGTNPRYITGAKRQVELCARFFPDWQIRIYTDNLENFNYSNNTNIHVLLGLPNIHGSFWRFLPVFESDNNITVIRDSDSRITIREYNAIQEWLQSHLLFHNIKDHDAHYEWPIMAGMWGYKGKMPVTFWDQSMLYSQGNNEYLKDQIWLRDIVWPHVEKLQLLHDIKHINWFSHTRNMLCNPFDFCGNGYTEHDLPLYAPSLSPTWKSFTTDENKFSYGQLLQT